MLFKQLRFGPTLLLRAREEPGFLDQVHVIFGGTGAVGGATALQLIEALEECLASISPTSGSPRVVVTGRSHQEVRRFTSRLFELQHRDHGRNPTQLAGVGYRTAGGVVVEMETLAVDPSIEHLVGISRMKGPDRGRAIKKFLAAGGLTSESPPKTRAAFLSEAVHTGVGQPFTSFLRKYIDRRGLADGGRRFRSVIVAIPLASIAAYKLRDLEVAGPHLGVPSESGEMEELKSKYLCEMRDDLARVVDNMADEVLVAHTTGVGGMFDEQPDGHRTIRLGFAHLGLDERLRQKQAFADRLTQLYAEKGIKMLITAAAIGIDSINVRKRPPMQAAIRQQLEEAKSKGHNVISDTDFKSGEISVYDPIDLSLYEEPHAAVELQQRGRLEAAYVLKSGENGYFTVSNADALYRVMRVASDSELGFVMARTALLGDDPLAPRFRANVCYYTETDYSRQIFDLLNQPELRNTQLTGLQPKALQDLGSAKHQGELHTLGLLILLHRLKTLNLDAISPRVDLQTFNPQHFFEQHSQVLTLDHVKAWDPAGLANQLRMLVTAQEDGDLAPLKHFYQAAAKRQEAAHRILKAVLRAVWTVPSLGSPVVYNAEDGQTRVLAGYYAAPLDLVITHRDSMPAHLRAKFERRGGGDESEFQRYVDFHIASFGFVDIRPQAVLVTCRSDRENLAENVQTFSDERSFRDALSRVERYSYFATSGLIALLVRLKRLWRLAHEFRLDLGTANTFRGHFPRDEEGRPLLVPGVVEAFRLVAEGLEKNTGLERIDGPWGYLPL